MYRNTLVYNRADIIGQSLFLLIYSLLCFLVLSFLIQKNDKMALELRIDQTQTRNLPFTTIHAFYEENVFYEVFLVWSFLPIHRSAWTASPLRVRLLFMLFKKAFSVIDFGIAKLESLLISLHFFCASSQVAVS